LTHRRSAVTLQPSAQRTAHNSLLMRICLLLHRHDCHAAGATRVLRKKNTAFVSAWDASFAVEPSSPKNRSYYMYLYLGAAELLERLIARHCPGRM
jgi:hypothetical protein